MRRWHRRNRTSTDKLRPNLILKAVESDPIVPSATDVPVVESANEGPPVAEGPDNLEALQDYHKYNQG